MTWIIVAFIAGMIVGGILATHLIRLAVFEKVKDGTIELHEPTA